MTDIPQSSTLVGAPARAPEPALGRWPPGVGLVIGAIASLGLWAGLARLALGLIG